MIQNCPDYLSKKIHSVIKRYTIILFAAQCVNCNTANTLQQNKREFTKLCWVGSVGILKAVSISLLVPSPSVYRLILPYTQCTDLKTR